MTAKRLFSRGLKVYVGAKYCERGTAKRLMRALEAQGHTITVDWTQHTKEDAASLALYATEDVKGVQRCNVAIFIMERPHKYKGCWVEMGVALGKGRKVIIIGHAGDSCVFIDHPNVSQISDLKTFIDASLKFWLQRWQMRRNIIKKFNLPALVTGKLEPAPPPANCKIDRGERLFKSSL
jgi:hypothetical protein